MAMRVILICIFLLTPVINNTVFADSASSSKSFFFLAMLMPVGALAIIALATTASIRIKISNIDIYLTLLILFILVNKHLQPHQNVSARWYDLPGLCLLYLILKLLSLKDFLLCLFTIVIAGIIEALHGSGQLYGYIPLVSFKPFITGSFQNPGPYSGFLTVSSCIAFGLYQFAERLQPISFVSLNNIRLVSFLGIAATLILLAATQSRAAWLAAAIGYAYILYYKYRHLLPVFWPKANKKAFKAIFICAAAFVMAAGAYGLYHIKKESVDGRMLIWKVAGNLIAERPLTGFGFDRFSANYMDAQAVYFTGVKNRAEVLRADNNYYAFNELLQLTVENGVLGLILLAITAVMFFSIRVNDKFIFLKHVAGAAMLSIYIFGMFSYPMHVLPLKIILILLLALAAALDTGKYCFTIGNVSGKRNLSIVAAKMVISGFAGCVLLAGANKLYLVSTAYKNWQQALNLYDGKLYNESIAEFKKAYSELHNNGDFLMHYGKALAINGNYAKAQAVLVSAKNHLNNTVIETSLGDTYKALGRYAEAEAAYKHAAGMVPGLFYPDYLLAKLYDDTGQESKAVSKANELLYKEIKIPSKAIQQIQQEMAEMIQNRADK